MPSGGKTESDLSKKGIQKLLLADPKKVPHGNLSRRGLRLWFVSSVAEVRPPVRQK